MLLSASSVRSARRSKVAGTVQLRCRLRQFVIHFSLRDGRQALTQCLSDPPRIHCFAFRHSSFLGQVFDHWSPSHHQHGDGGLPSLADAALLGKVGQFETWWPPSWQYVQITGIVGTCCGWLLAGVKTAKRSGRTPAGNRVLSSRLESCSVLVTRASTRQHKKILISGTIGAFRSGKRVANVAVLSPGTVMKSSGERPPIENTVSNDTVLFPLHRLHVEMHTGCTARFTPVTVQR